MSSLRSSALLAALVLLLASCARDDAATAPDETTTTTTAGAAAGAFGDLGVVCGPAPEGVPLAAADTGVTADSIRVSTFSDPGFSGRPGLNQELFDTAEAFTRWCNEAGGINGRRLELVLRDARLTEYKNRIIEACDEGDFMMVGGGAVFDNTGQVDRLACGLPNVPGFVITAEATGADLMLQPIPNPVGELNISDFIWLGEEFPDTTGHVAILTASLQQSVMQAERYREGIETLGWNVVYHEQYNPAGETTYRPFVEAMRAAGARGLIFLGEPVGLGNVLKAIADSGFEPDWVRSDTNQYDPLVLSEGGDAIRDVYLPTQFYPFLDPDLAARNPATQQYRDLIADHDPGGKVANLGVHGLSAWLLFAVAARDYGAELTRDCVWERLGRVTEWTGGGLHAPQDVAGRSAPPCFALFEATPGGFLLTDIGATDGIYACSDRNVIALEGDYGAGVKCPNPAYATDPKPSTCSGASSPGP